MVGDIKEGISTRYYRQVSNIFTDFLALEPLNGAGGNVTQAAALGRVGFKTGEEALLWWLPVLDVTVAR